MQRNRSLNACKRIRGQRSVANPNVCRVESPAQAAGRGSYQIYQRRRPRIQRPSVAHYQPTTSPLTRSPCNDVKGLERGRGSQHMMSRSSQSGPSTARCLWCELCLRLGVSQDPSTRPLCQAFPAAAAVALSWCACDWSRQPATVPTKRSPPPSLLRLSLPACKRQ